MFKAEKQTVKLIANTILGTLYYMTNWDVSARPNALRSQVEDFRKKLKKKINELKEESFLRAGNLFLEQCTKAVKENKDFNYWESDICVNAFINLVNSLGQHRLVAETKLSEDARACIGEGVVDKIKEVLAELENELNNKKRVAVH